MGAAAQLDRRPGLEHADDVAVLVAEERDRAQRLGLGLGGLEDPRPLVAERLGVDQPLDLGDLLGGDRLVVREVEAQPVGADVRAGLLDVLAEHPAQRPVQQVRAGVVAADGAATLDVDRRRGLLAGRDVALDDAREVAAQTGQGERGVEHLGPAGVGDDRAGVADLATRLGVERRAVEEDLDGAGRVAVGGVAAEHREHPALRLVARRTRRTRSAPNWSSTSR